MDKKTTQEWKVLIEPALKSKVREFQLIGYHDVTTDELWSCLEKQIWKGNPEKRIHEIVQDIFRFQASTYMNYIQIGALRVEKHDLLDSINALSVNEEE